MAITERVKRDSEFVSVIASITIKRNFNIRINYNIIPPCALSVLYFLNTFYFSKFTLDDWYYGSLDRAIHQKWRCIWYNWCLGIWFMIHGYFWVALEFTVMLCSFIKGLGYLRKLFRKFYRQFLFPLWNISYFSFANFSKFKFVLCDIQVKWPKYFNCIFTMSHIFIFQLLSQQNQADIFFATMIKFSFSFWASKL